MNWSTNCLSLGIRWMNPNTAFSPSHFRPPPEKSRHRMSAPAQAAHLPICHGAIMSMTSANDRKSKVDDDNYLQITNLPFPLSLPQRTDEIVLSTMVGMMSTFSRKSVAELTVKATWVSKPGSISTELKLSSEFRRVHIYAEFLAQIWTI